MLGYSASKAAERGARAAGASEETARAVGQVTATGFVITGGDPVGGLAYVGESLVREGFGPQAGDRVRTAVRCYDAGRTVERVLDHLGG